MADRENVIVSITWHVIAYTVQLESVGSHGEKEMAMSGMWGGEVIFVNVFKYYVHVMTYIIMHALYASRQGIC